MDKFLTLYFHITFSSLQTSVLEGFEAFSINL